MNKLDFLSPKLKQYLGVAVSLLVVALFVAPQMPGATEKLTQWVAWASQVLALVSTVFGLQVFDPTRGK